MSAPATTPEVTPLDLEAIRSAFPALRRTQGDHPVAYFDGPGGTQVPQAVVEAMADYLQHHNANTHWVYPTSEETDALIAASRATFADFLGCGADEVVFGANMTTISFHLARALGRGWVAGDEVIVTELDHHANVAPWQALARERGIVLRTVRLDTERAELDWADLEAAFTPRTRLLAIGAASNALGTITDVARAAATARAHGALSYVDAVHYAPHRLPDVAAIGCDFLACSAYKFCGPHVGVLYGRRALLERLDVPKLAPAPDTVPERLETGTQNHEGIVGAAAAVDFLASWGRGATRRERLTDFYARLEHQEGQLVERLLDGLDALGQPRVTGVARGRPRTATVAFRLPALPATEVARRLAARGLFVSHGHYYAQTVAERYGVGEEGWVRVGCAPYTSPGEIDRLLQALDGIQCG